MRSSFWNVRSMEGLDASARRQKICAADTRGSRSTFEAHTDVSSFRVPELKHFHTVTALSRDEIVSDDVFVGPSFQFIARYTIDLRLMKEKCVFAGRDELHFGRMGGTRS